MQMSDETEFAGPLRGLKVLELTNMIAAPMAGSLLADAGADVVKVEHPQRGDDLRTWPPHKDGKSLWFKATNRNKKLITIDLSQLAGQDLVRRMIGHFDVLIENFRPGTMERWNLSYEVLSSLNPRLVMLRISGYGQSGPYGQRPGYATIAEAMSGIPSFTGFADRPPTFSAFPLGDSVAGVLGAGAVMMAIYERDVAGSNLGQVIDVSLFESLFRLVDAQVIGYDQAGLVKQRNGNRMDEDSPRNAYRTSDGKYIAISAGSQRVFARLANAIGQPELNTDPRFSTTKDRVKNAVELDEIITNWFTTHTSAAALTELEAADAVAGPLYDIRAIMEDPHYLARDDVIEVSDDDFGTVRMHGVIPKFLRTPGGVRFAARNKGHDNAAFFMQLGVEPAELEQLAKQDVI
jgi:crotonobetainyl-CoA:carnitine CoA-transferase CaiB-like acyl-CoA transferase